MEFCLVVVRPFGPHASGDTVTDPQAIASILGSEHMDHVVRVPGRVPAVAPAEKAAPTTAQEH